MNDEQLQNEALAPEAISAAAPIDPSSLADDMSPVEAGGIPEADLEAADVEAADVEAMDVEAMDVEAMDELFAELLSEQAGGELEFAAPELAAAAEAQMPAESQPVAETVVEAESVAVEAVCEPPAAVVAESEPSLVAEAPPIEAAAIAAATSPAAIETAPIDEPADLDWLEASLEGSLEASLEAMPAEAVPSEASAEAHTESLVAEEPGFDVPDFMLHDLLAAEQVSSLPGMMGAPGPEVLEAAAGEFASPSRSRFEAEAEQPERTSPPLEDLIRGIDAQLERVAPVAAPVEQPAVSHKQFSQLDDYVVFTLSGGEYALPVRDVAEIGRVPTVTKVPNVPEFVRGITNLRGEIVPVLNLPQLLGLQETALTARGRVLFLQARDQVAASGLLVDEVKGIQRIPSQQLEHVTGLVDDKVTSVLRGVHGRGDRLLNVLDLEQVFRLEEFQKFERR